MTSPGHLEGGDAHRRLGLPGEGPARVIADKALFELANAEREMRLVSLRPGVTLDEVRSAVGWPLRVAPDVGETPAPTGEGLRLMREELDPRELYRRPAALHGSAVR